MEKYQYSEQERAVLECLKQPFAVYQFINKKVITLILSDGFCDLFGYEDKEQAYYDMDNDMYKDTHPDDIARIADAAFHFATEGGKYEVIYRTKKANSQDYFIVHAAGEHVYTESGVRLAHVWYTDEGSYTGDAVVRGLELNKALNSALHQESLIKANYYDHLTGLPSMTYFFELAEVADAKEISKGGRLVFLYMDLSGMKFFNHKNGFAEGDKYLQSFARILGDLFGNECCSHLAQDHFGVFTSDENVEDKLEELFCRSSKLNDGDSLPVRVGIFRSDTGDVPVSTACDRAKLACDAIRGGYDSQFNYYKEELRDESMKKQKIITGLDKALSEGWIKVYYQPIIRAVNGRVCDEEALSRWDDPEMGFLPPGEFIPTLEEAGLIYKLDLYVLEQILKKMTFQEEEGLYIVPHSLNLSRSDFDACDIVEEIRRRVDDAGVDRSKITIEITESIIGSDSEFMKNQIERFKELGFPVWLDDFGSGYSSMEILQSINFDLIKFDMSFMKRLDEGTNGKIILAELMRMANALGVDTVCEGVETEEQVWFLREIGCSKLQGFYYCRPITPEMILDRYEKGIQIGFEDPEEADYYESIGRLNLYDMTSIASGDEATFKTIFNTIPVAILEVRESDEIKVEDIEFIRTNPSYRNFLENVSGIRIHMEQGVIRTPVTDETAALTKLMLDSCKDSGRAFVDEQTPDGSTVHFMVRKIGTNHVTGKTALIMAALSVTEPDEGASFVKIARALAADYVSIYYVDLDKDMYVEYTSTVGSETIIAEKHGEHFFKTAKEEMVTRIHEEDREVLLRSFNEENILHELDEQGVFTATYRILDSGEPVYANMKVTRMAPGSRKLVIGVSIIDSQMRQQALIEKIKRDQTAYARIKALAGDYLSMYTIDPQTDEYYEYSASEDYKELGLANAGEDFFNKCVEDGKGVVYEEDYPMYKEKFNKEKILKEIREKDIFIMKYHLMISGRKVPVVLKIASVKERDGEKLIAGVRTWKERN